MPVPAFASALVAGLALAEPALVAAPAALAPVAPTAPLATAATTADDELPGYYRWYKKAGDDPRLPDEVARDRAMEAGDDWAPKELAHRAPDWSFPDGTGRTVPLRVGGDGRQTLVVTFQSWW